MLARTQGVARGKVRRLLRPTSGDGPVHVDEHDDTDRGVAVRAHAHDPLVRVDLCASEQRAPHLVRRPPKAGAADGNEHVPVRPRALLLSKRLRCPAGSYNVGQWPRAYAAKVGNLVFYNGERERASVSGIKALMRTEQSTTSGATSLVWTTRRRSSTTSAN
jgi:hypothetical protein